MSDGAEIRKIRDEMGRTRYLLFCGGAANPSGNFAAYDVTGLALDAMREDRAAGHDNEKGPSFGWLVKQTTEIGSAHRAAYDAWCHDRPENEAVRVFHEGARPVLGLRGRWDIFSDGCVMVRRWSI